MCKVFPVPKSENESTKRKCPMHNGNSSSPQVTRRNLQSRNNLLSYCGLVDARISASEKDLPVCISN